MAKDSYLGPTHFRNSAISEFRKYEFWRVGYEGQLRDTETQLRGAGRARNSTNYGKFPYLGPTHLRNSVISEFRGNKVWRIDLGSQLLDVKTQLRGAGRALTSPHFGKWPKTPTWGQRIFVIPQFRNSGIINSGAPAFGANCLT